MYQLGSSGTDVRVIKSCLLVIKIGRISIHNWESYNYNTFDNFVFKTSMTLIIIYITGGDFSGSLYP